MGRYECQYCGKDFPEMITKINHEENLCRRKRGKMDLRNDHPEISTDIGIGIGPVHGDTLKANRLAMALTVACEWLVNESAFATVGDARDAALSVVDRMLEDPDAAAS